MQDTLSLAWSSSIKMGSQIKLMAKFISKSKKIGLYWILKYKPRILASDSDLRFKCFKIGRQYMNVAFWIEGFYFK